MNVRFEVQDIICIKQKHVFKVNKINDFTCSLGQAENAKSSNLFPLHVTHKTMNILDKIFFKNANSHWKMSKLEIHGPHKVNIFL